MRKPTLKEWLVTGLTAVLIALFQIGIDFDPTIVEDWQFWALTVAGSVVRSVSQKMLETVFNSTVG